MDKVIRGEVPSGSGYGYGDSDYGDGDGYGSGVGGSGYGDSGYGNGVSGDGYGYGSGYGYSGYGYGYGSGYGYGDSDYGDGDGYGGSKEYWSACIRFFAKQWNEIQRTRLVALQSGGATIAYWCSDKNGRACNGGTNSPVAVGIVEKSCGPLGLCNRGTLHATLIPPNWVGNRWWIVALIGEVVGDGEKYGALEREIIGECN